MRYQNNGMLDRLMCISGYYIAIQRSLDKELPTEREFGNFVDRYAVPVKKDSSNNAPSGFASSFGSDPAHFVANYSSINIAQRTS